MNVENLLKFLHTLEEPIRAIGGTKVANELNEVCDGLRPFGELPIGQFAEFLRNADHYAKTGEVPLKATASKARAKAKAIDAEKVKTASQTVSGLYERAIDEGVDYSHIEAELKKLDKSLSKDEAVALAKEFNIAKSVTTKKAAFEAIQARIFDRKQSFQRTSF